MSNFNVSEIKRSWPILSTVDSELIDQVRTLLVFGGSGNEAILVTKDDEVYALGTNKKGCLGIGIKSPTFYAMEVEGLSGKGVVSEKFVYSATDTPHVLALTKTGMIYGCGYNEHVQVINDSWSLQPNSDIYSPVRIGGFGNKKLIDVACGDHHSVTLNIEGQLFAWGKDARKEGMNGLDGQPYMLGQDLEGVKFTSVSCRPNSTSAVTEQGQIYTWNENKAGSKVSFRENVFVKKVVCGTTHTLVLSEEGFIYAWGENECGQLGNGSNNSSSIPWKIPSTLLGRVVDIAVGRYVPVSAALNERGQVFAWGKFRDQEFCIPTLTRFSSVEEVLWYSNTIGSMDQPLELKQKREMNLVESIKRGFDNQKTSDLAFKFQDKTIHVHKAILQLRSTYFERMFENDWAEKNQNVIEHEQYSYEVFKSFLRYLYTDEVRVSPENAPKLLELADQYFEPRLGKLCEEIIEKNQRFDSGSSSFNPLFVKRGIRKRHD